MRAGEWKRIALVAASMFVSGCASNPVPQAWRPSAEVAQRSVQGGWISIESGAPSEASRRQIVEGELIAIDASAFYVLTVTGLQAVPQASAARFTLIGYRPPSGALAAWAIAGGVSTLSHGGFLLLTAPIWAVTGIVAVHAEGRAGVMHDLDTARPFARFPQGLPTGLDPKSLGVLTIPRSRSGGGARSAGTLRDDAHGRPE